MSSAPAADYTILILETLALSPIPMGISDISHKTGINKNAISRILGSLVESGWICQEELKYQLTLKPFRLTSNALGRIDLYDAAQPLLNRLWQETGDSCYLAVLEDNGALYLGHKDSARDLKIAGRIGGSYPLINSAPGKVLLAYSGEEYRTHYLRDIKQLSEEQIRVIEEKCACIREQGWATDIEEYGPGVICFAAPIFDMYGKVIGSIGISTSTVYFDEKTMIADPGAKVLAAAREISRRLGA